MFFIDSLFSFVDGAIDVAATAVDAVVENPIKAVCVCGVGVATGGLVTVFAAPIAAAIGTTGILGATASGTAIRGRLRKRKIKHAKPVAAAVAA